MDGYLITRMAYPEVDDAIMLQDTYSYGLLQSQFLTKQQQVIMQMGELLARNDLLMEPLPKSSTFETYYSMASGPEELVKSLNENTVANVHPRPPYFPKPEQIEAWEKQVDAALEEQAKKDVKGWATFRDSGDAELYKKLAVLLRLAKGAKKDVKGWAAFRDSGDAELYKKLVDEFKELQEATDAVKPVETRHVVSSWKLNTGSMMM